MSAQWRDKGIGSALLHSCLCLAVLHPQTWFYDAAPRHTRTPPPKAHAVQFAQVRTSARGHHLSLSSSAMSSGYHIMYLCRLPSQSWIGDCWHVQVLFCTYLSRPCKSTWQGVHVSNKGSNLVSVIQRQGKQWSVPCDS